jgi:hypothetical protein
MADDKKKPERYSAAWNAALQRFSAALERFAANNHDPAALKELSESGGQLGWIVPIEKK